MKSVKIIVVDTEEIFLEGLSSVLRRLFQSNAVLSGRDFTEITTLENYSEPDIVIFGKDKFTPINVKSIKEVFCNAKIVIMMSPDDLEDPVDIIKHGAFACLSKTIETNELFSCLQLILTGRIIVSNMFAEKFFQNLSQARTYKRKKTVLSEREIEVTKLVTQGKTNREISKTLCVTENTIKVHMKHIFSKVKCKNRQQLVTFAHLGRNLSLRDTIRP